MGSPNFIIDGHLRLPGLVRMPPPFGPALDNAQPSTATQVSTPIDPAAHTCGSAGIACHKQWPQCVTALSVGMACTLAATLLGWQTGQYRQPAAEFDQAIMAATAQPTTPIVLLESPPAEPVASAQTQEPEESETAIAAATAVVRAPDTTLDGAEVTRPVITAASPVVTQLPTKSIRTRMLVQAVEPAPTHELERPAILLDEESAFIEFESVPIDTAPVASGYAAPGTPVHIELQRHIRFTD